jgi:uncharacterized damage-inducible protein DinB
MAAVETKRVDPPHRGDDRELLTSFLDYQRETVYVKCAGLSDEDARRALLPSEMTTVAGLVSHLRWVESYWFDVVLGGAPDVAPYSEEDPDGEFRVGLHLPLSTLLADYRAQCAASRAVVARMDLDDESPADRRGVSVRWALLHMIEETARHAGPLDILRELLDGVTGE